MNKTCIVVGASHAASQLVISLRQQGWQDRIVLIGEEPHPPYQRPPLSKAFLLDKITEMDLFIRSPELYVKQNIETHFGTKVTGIDAAQKTVQLDSGETMHYDKLVMCTGSVVRELPIPGTQLHGVHYLRTLDHINDIKQTLPNAKNAVIIGGGYIGLETAAALKQLDLNVTVLEMESRLLARVTAPEMSDFFYKVHTQHGVNIITNATAREITGDGKVSGVNYSLQGSDTTESIPADLVIVGVGVLPNTLLAEAAGLEINNGIVVDEYARSSVANIFAVGDCTNHPNSLYGNLRLESVPNAVEQAKAAASLICDKPRPHDSLPWFWSDQYDLKLQIAGINRGYDQAVIRGSTDDNEFTLFYLKDNKIIAADCMNHPQEFLMCKRIIPKQAEVDVANLVNVGFDLKLLM